MKKSILLLTTLIIMVLGAGESISVSAEPTTQCTVYSGSNVEGQNYRSSSSPVYSYLTNSPEGGYMRFQANAGVDGYLVEYYDSEYNLKKTTIIEKELPIFGAFYETADNYFILSGQSNPEESNDVEVFRITKYDKNWRNLAVCWLNGANTYYPFSAGSARMTDSGKYLLIRTCHTMYTSKNDGLNHQANVTIQVDMDAMEITDSYVNVATSSLGYVSHSFNQFIKTEDNKIVAVDHGDAYPRSIVLIKYNKDYSEGTFQGRCNPYDLIEISGKIGNNYTGYSVGGFEISSTDYIVAGNEDINMETSSAGRNIFVSTMNKSTGEISKNMITNYAEGTSSSESATTPHLVKIGTDSYMLLWNKEGVTYYTKIDGSGKKVGDIYSLAGNLSDCVPLVSGGKLVWYTWKDETNTFYSISLSNLSNTETVPIVNGHKFSFSEPDDNYIVTKTCTECGYKESINTPNFVACLWKEEDTIYYSSGYLKRYDKNRELPYTFRIYYSDNADSSFSNNSEIVVVSSDESVISVDSSAKKLVMGDTAGLATIQVYPKYKPSMVKSYIFRVGDEGEIDINDCEITMPTEDIIYTGSAHVPEPTVTYKGYTLQKNTDYTFTAANNVAVGTGTLTVTGKGIFGKSKDKTFAIKAGTLNDCTITLNTTDMAFTGYQRNCGVRVSNAGETVPSDLYTVSYSNNIYPGVATVKITGKDTLPGEVEKTFTISPCDLTECRISLVRASSYPEMYVYSGDAKRPLSFVYNKEGSIINTSYTDITYSNNINAGEATVTVTAEEGSTYMTGSVSMTFTIEPLDIFKGQIISTSVPAVVYTGHEIKPDISVKVDDNPVDMECCEIVYTDNVEAGTASFTVKGVGNYTGSVEGTFDIQPYDIENADMRLVIDEYEYAENAAYGIQVKYYNLFAPVLKEGRDYTVEYPKISDAGEYPVVINGIGSCYGTVELKITINKATPDIESVEVTSPAEIFASTLYSDVVLTCADQPVKGTLSLDKVVFRTGTGNYGYTFTPTDTDNYNVVKGEVSITVSSDALVKIEASGEPENKSYVYGEEFDITGMTITAYYESGAMADVTNLVEADTLHAGDSEVTLRYTVDDVEKTCTVEGISVGKATPVVDNVVITKPEKIYTDTLFSAVVLSFSSSVPGSISLDEAEFTVGTKTYGYTFIPEDTDNYTNVKGNVEITVQENISISDKDNNQDKDNVQDKDNNADKDNVQDKDKDSGSGNADKDKTPDSQTEDEEDVEIGRVVVDTKTGINFEVIEDKDGIPVIEFTKTNKNTKGTVNIPDTVKVNGKKYKVTSIAPNAFKNNKKITKVVIGKNIKKIGKNAFYGCSKLKLIHIKTTKLTEKNVDKKAFKGIKGSVKIKVPASKKKAYKALFKKLGVSKKVKIY